MKHRNRKCFTVCFLLLLLLQTFHVGAVIPEQTGYSEVLTPCGPEALFSGTAVDFSVSYLYYDQLQSIDQKNLYTRFRQATPESCTISMSLSSLPAVPVPSGGPDQTFINRLNTAVTEIVWPAYVAAVMDDPLLFWCENTIKTSYTYHYRGTVLTSVTIQCSFVVGKGITVESYPAALQALQDVLNGLSFSQNSTRYELLRQFHDWLCERIVYDLDAPCAHSVYGALVDGKAVCEGYAAAFKLLCDVYQIPCMTVFGYSVSASGEQGYHAWNIVRMEDGVWYGVDTTWDDNDKIYDDFFLTGSATVPTHFDKLPFKISHQENEDYFGNGAVLLRFPVLSETAFRFPKYDVNQDGAADSLDIVALLQYLAGIKEAPAGVDLDLNGDGAFNPEDGTVLLQYLSGILL